MTIRAFRNPDDAAAVVSLWERCDLVRAQNNPWKDIARKLRVNPEMFLVGEVDGKIVVTVMAGYDGHRGWINYLAVDLNHRHKGYGRAIMEAAEMLLRSAGCPKINLQVRATNHSAIEFYQRVGYAVDEVSSMGKRLEHD